MSDAISSTLSIPDGDEPPNPARATGRSVRRLLGMFALALVAPTILFSAFVVWRYADNERGRLERETSEVAQIVSAALDRELTGLFATLDVLSSSPFLKTNDLESFYKQAAELLERQGIVTVLTDPSGQQLVNLRLPWGAALMRSYSNFVESALSSDRPQVGNLVRGRVTGRLQLVITKAIRDASGPRYVLFFSLPLERMQRILEEADVANIYNASIIDRQYMIVARSRRPDEFVGRPATQPLKDNTEGRRQGTWVGKTVDGEDVFSAFSRSRLSDFLVSVSVRATILNEPFWRSLSLLAALGVTLVGLSSLLAVLVGRRITGAMGKLAREAARLGRGEPVQPLSTALTEADVVGTALSAASANLRERETELREANEEMQRFAYIVSHDLRSPLVNIMGFTTELEALKDDVFTRVAELRARLEGEADGKDAALAREFDEALGFIKTSIAKMDRLINAILKLSREGRRDFTPERVNMDRLVATVRASLAIQAEAAAATVEIHSLPPLVSDRVALEQIFSNLVDNAIKYLRRGVPGRIVVTGRARAGTVFYEVRDNGRGVDSRDRERIFDLFRRSGVQDRPGEGIGLAHVRALVRRLGGSITLTSAPGQGSTFTVALPQRWTGDRQRKAA